MTIKIQEGDYFKIEGLTQEQYEFLVYKFLDAGCEDYYNHFHDIIGLENFPYLEWYDGNLCATDDLEPNAREIKLTDFKEYQMNNTVEFPDYNFKLDCGDDPNVRQWLKDNGCKWESGCDIVERDKCAKHLYVNVSSLRKTITWDPKEHWDKTYTDCVLVTPVFTLTDLIIEKPVDNKLKDELKLLEEQQREIAEKMKELQEKIGK